VRPLAANCTTPTCAHQRGFLMCRVGSRIPASRWFRSWFRFVAPFGTSVTCRNQRARPAGRVLVRATRSNPNSNLLDRRTRSKSYALGADGGRVAGGMHFKISGGWAFVGQRTGTALFLNASRGGGETRGRFEGYIDEKSGTRKYETGNGGGRTWKEGSPGCFDLSKGQRDFDSCTRTKVHARTSIQLRRSRWNPKHLLSPQPCTATDVVVLARGAQLLCEHSQLAGRAGIRR